MSARSSAGIAAGAQTTPLSKNDILIQTRGRKRGRVGYVAYTLSGRVRMRWSTRRQVLPRVRYIDDLRLVTIRQGARISVDIKPATLARYGVARVDEALLAEWCERRAQIDQNDSLEFQEKYEAKMRLRAEVMDRAEPIEFA